MGSHDYVRVPEYAPFIHMPALWLIIFLNLLLKWMLKLRGCRDDASHKQALVTLYFRVF